ncbi:MAG: hypothetical protein L6R43_15935 [Planctomycetes bacterium]|nr:hypothetical protein [Planctomycetota bacterium]
MTSAAFALFRVSFLACWRSHGNRAAVALGLLLTLFAPSLVAFAFSGAEALAFEGALGTPCLLGPLLALFAGASLATGDRGGEGLDPLLRSPASPATVLLSLASGIAAAAALPVLLGAGLAAAALSHRGSPAAPAALLPPVLVSVAGGFAAAAAGIALGTAAPRALALVLSALLPGILLFSRAASLPGPSPEVLLLSRDAARGGVPASVAALSVLASLLAAGAAAALTVALLRAKDVVHRPGST